MKKNPLKEIMRKKKTTPVRQASPTQVNHEPHKMRQDSIEYYYFDSVGEFVDKLICELARSSSNMITLSTRDSWWAKGLITPYAGTLKNRCVGFGGPFDEEEIVKDLRLCGLTVTPHSKEEHFFFIKKAPN